MQDSKPQVCEELERVGISNLKTLVVTTWKGREYRFLPEIELTIDLKEEKRGAHMSRLIESISEIIEDEAQSPHSSMEELAKKILDRVREKHYYQKGNMKMTTDLVVERETPVTKRETMESHKVVVEVERNDEGYRKTLEVQVMGNTVCPHALSKTKGKSHIQRAISHLRVTTDYENEIPLEKMIETVEEAFPCPVYTLLKTEDEKHVVQKMFENPRFVEDVTRLVLQGAKERFKNSEIEVKTISEESIHRHDVVAEGSTCT